METITKAKKLMKLMKQLRTEQIAELTRCFKAAGDSEGKLRQEINNLKKK